ncbi:MAG: hypothetical protein HKN18_17905 [Silicimonas sp.]|nr:hypothetical protein [Silicimonas sp.]
MTNEAKPSGNYFVDNRKSIAFCLLGTLLGALAGGLTSFAYGIVIPGFLTFGAVAGLMVALGILAFRHFSR